MLLTTWLRGNLKTHLVSKLNPGNLIFPNEKTTTINSVNSLQLRRLCIINPEKEKTGF